MGIVLAFGGRYDGQGQWWTRGTKNTQEENVDMTQAFQGHKSGGWSGVLTALAET